MVDGKWNETLRRVSLMASRRVFHGSSICEIAGVPRSSSCFPPHWEKLLLLYTVLAVNKHRSVLNPFHFEPVSVIVHDLRRMTR